MFEHGETMSDEIHSAQSGNRLLSRLPRDAYQALNQHIEIVELSVRETVFKRGREFRYVYFPISSVLSVIASFRNGGSIEVAAIGNEGFTCSDVLIGGVVAPDSCICQVRGQSARMRVAAFQEAVAGDTPLRRITQQYMRAYISQLAQIAACNRLHTNEERFANWTLTMRDRACGDRFPMNDEFLGYMLGEPRSVVKLITRTFEHAGLIRCEGGYITVMNEAEIEGITCECYQTIKRLHQQVLAMELG